jgi:hypothetical protein
MRSANYWHFFDDLACETNFNRRERVIPVMAKKKKVARTRVARKTREFDRKKADLQWNGDVLDKLDCMLDEFLAKARNTREMTRVRPVDLDLAESLDEIAHSDGDHQEALTRLSKSYPNHAALEINGDAYKNLLGELYRWKLEETVTQIMNAKSEWFAIWAQRRTRTGTKKQQKLLNLHSKLLVKIDQHVEHYNDLRSKRPKCIDPIAGPACISREQVLDEHSNPFMSMWISLDGLPSTSILRPLLDDRESIKRDYELLESLEEDSRSLCRFYAHEAVTFSDAIESWIRSPTCPTRSGAIALLRGLYVDILDKLQRAMREFKFTSTELDLDHITLTSLDFGYETESEDDDPREYSAPQGHSYRRIQHYISRSTRGRLL